MLAIGTLLLMSITAQQSDSSAKSNITEEGAEMKKELSSKQPRSKRFTLQQGRRDELLAVLKARFEKNMARHQGLDWAKVQARLEADPEKLWSLNEMERTGGEPDVVGHDKKSGEYIFFDCSEQTPAGRISLCYDREALDSRKEHKPRSQFGACPAGAGGIDNEQTKKQTPASPKVHSWIDTKNKTSQGTLLQQFPSRLAHTPRSGRADLLVSQKAVQPRCSTAPTYQSYCDLL